MLEGNREEMVAAMDVIFGTAEKTSVNPVYNNVLMLASGNTLTMTTSDGFMHMTAECPVKLDGERFSLCTNVHKLSTVLKSMRARNISVRVKGSKMYIRASKGSEDEHKGFMLSFLSADVFPRETSADGSIEVEILQAHFLQSIKRVKACISQKTHRLYMAGMFCDFTPDGLHLVATDSHRMSMDTLPSRDCADVKFIVPRKAVEQLTKLLDSDAEDPVKLSIVKDGEKLRLVRFEVPGIRLSAQLIDVDFPNYKNVIPNSNEVVAVLKRTDLEEKLKQACAVHDKAGENVVLGLTENGANLSAKGSQSADESSHDMDADFNAEPMSICFNSTYLNDMVSAFEGFERIEMKIKDARGSVLCLPAGESSSLRYVLMPVTPPSPPSSSPEHE